MRVLPTNPYTCRKVSDNLLERALVIPFGISGDVALFEIIREHEIAVGAPAGGEDEGLPEGATANC